jgi:hypothetical protein
VKVAATVLAVAIGLTGLTACGSEDKPKEPDFSSVHVDAQEMAKIKAQLAKQDKEKKFWDNISSFIDEYRSADEFWHEREIPEEVKQKAIKAGWKACKVLKSDGIDAARESVAEDLGLDLSWGPDSDDAATIVNGAEWGMCPQ